MGGSTQQQQQQTQVQQTTPWAPAAQTLTGILGKLDALPNAPDRTGIINNAYQQFVQQMSPYANGAYNDPTTNPVLQKYLQVARDDAANNINGQFAAAGRDLSGANTQALGRGIMQAEAPILYDAYNQSQGRQATAASNLFGAGGQTASLLSGLDQTDLQRLAAATGIALGPAQAFGTTTGNSTGTTTTSVPIGQQIAAYGAIGLGGAGNLYKAWKMP